MLHSYGREIYVGILCVFLIGISFVAGKYAALHDSFTCVDDSQYACSRAYYETVIERYGALAALRDLETRQNGGAARTYCHPLLHLIGEAAGKEFGTVADAYKYGKTFCRSGYYHGILEGLFAGDGDRLLENVDAICADVRTRGGYSYDYFSCAHGIGHGLMAYFDHDLFASLKGCNKLSGSWEQSSCHGGVFMENVISDSVDMPSRFLKDDDLLYPCNVVEDRYKQPCFQMQTSHMLAKNGGDFAATFALCRTVDEGFQTACFESIGRDVSGWTYGDATAAHAYCALGESQDERAACTAGVAVDYIQSVSPFAAYAYCADVGPELHTQCLEAVQSQLRAL